jgi:hypothetical protein
MTLYMQIKIIRQIPHGRINLAAVGVVLFDCLFCKRESLAATNKVTSSCETGENHEKFYS